MPAFLTLDSLSAATSDGRPLFSDLTLTLGREVVGLVGRNGCGKSTLISILAGERPPQSGTLARRGRVALLRQIAPDAGTAADALGVREGLERLARLEAGQGSMEDTERADWTLEQDLAEALSRMGLTGLPLDQPIATLSGGERTRLALAHMLMGRPDLLLMDEPTNNLDAGGRAAIAGMLAGWQGGALIASHDRELLDSMDRIVHLSPVGCQIFGGGWSGFEQARDAMRDRAGADLDRAANEAQRLARSVQRQTERQARRDKAGRAKKAKGGEPRILLGALEGQAERTAARNSHLAARIVAEAQAALEQARERVEIVAPLHVDLPPSGLAGNRTLLRLDDVRCERQGRRLFGPLSLTITGPRRVVVSGANGSGKTSLLRIVMGEEAPAAGAVVRAEGALAMLDQHMDMLDPALDLLGIMQARHPGMTAGQAHAVLARFAFRNQDALRPASTLSGGERLRAGLALVTGGPVPPQMLVLDEPTNHLDMEAVELLERALAAWDGALLLVSHDRRFLDAVGYDLEIRLPDGG